MNKIIGVACGKLNFCGTSKHYEVIIPDGKAEATAVPPLTQYEFTGNGIQITIEKALLPFKEATAIPDENGEIADAAAKAAKYFKAQGSALILAALGDLLVAYAAAFLEGENISPAVAAVKAEILSHVSDVTYSLDDGLKKLPLNYDYIRKLFKKETGITPHEFLLNERMQLARGLILGRISNQYSPYSVSQIAESCGYSEPLYFSRVFKKYFGVAPSEYGKN
ncbi:MAG: helix-turn-helix transcriptional regulator [Clostridia bacterium]|nr:helix-turn-helix transcriptional regulator [Clostridia bacterium]